MRYPPVFRLLSLAALGVALFRYSLPAQAAVAVLLLGVAAVRGRDSLSQVWRAIRRIRWLLISLVLVFLPRRRTCFRPGTPPCSARWGAWG